MTSNHHVISGTYKKLRSCLLFIVFGLVVLTPQYFVHYPNLIDDGTDIAETLHISPAVFITSQFHSERAYILKAFLRYLSYNLLGLDVAKHFLVMGVLLGILGWLFYEV